MSEQTSSQIYAGPCVGIDIGGTSTRIGLFKTLSSPDFTLLDRFPTHRAFEQQLQAIVTTLKRVDRFELIGIGASIGGRITKNGRSVLFAPNLPDYIDKPFAQELETQCRCPVRLAHDTVCGLLAEKAFGALQHDERCAYLTLSTGTGAAVHQQQGTTALTLSIEIGHQLLDGNTLVCLCGQVGCLETFTGGRQLELRLGHTLAQITDDAFWKQFAEKLSLGLVNLVQLTRIETIAISGAIALHNPSLLTLLQQNVHERLCNAELELKLAELGENAPLVGAALLLKTPEETLLH